MPAQTAYDYLVWSVGLLLAAGAACYVLNRLAGLRRAVPGLAALASLAALVMGALIVRAPSTAPEASVGTFELYMRVPALFRLTPFISAVNLLALAFGFLVVLYSLSYFGGEGRDFYPLALWAVAGASVALTTGHLLVFIFAWELVTLTLYLLVGLGGPEARAGAAKTFAILGFSDAMIIFGIAALVRYRGPGALSMSALEGPLHVIVTDWRETAVYLALLVGALAKAGAFPLHTWIPAAAEHAPVPAMALLPASLDKLLGIVLLARISLGFFTLSAGLQTLLMIIGAVTIIAAVMMAMMQHELKRLLSFHAVSQVGYMVLGIGTGVPIGVVGGLFHMVNHAIYKSLLFLGGGAVEKRAGEMELDNLGGLARAMPWTFVGFLVGSLAISGVPPLNGFVSKWLVYQGVIEGGGHLMPVLLGAAVVGSALTLASFVKAVHSVFLGQPAEPAIEAREAPAAMLLPMGVLAALCVLLGLGASSVVWGFLAPSALRAAGMPVADLARAEGTGLAFATGSWVPLTAAALVLVGLALGLLAYWVGRAFTVRRARRFVGGEVATPAPTHVSGTGFYRTVRELPILRGLYREAEGEVFDLYRLGGQYGLRVVEFLRGLHTGVLETYVTWVLAGAALVLALIFLL